MSTSPDDVVTAFMEAMARLDYDTALALVAPDCEYVNAPLGTVHGHEGIRSLLEPFFAPTLENEWVFKARATDGPIVFAERLDRHRLEGGWVELPVVGIWEVHDGLITAWREYFDLPTLERAMAAVGAGVGG